jgi:alpha,alpha-trehalase
VASPVPHPAEIYGGLFEAVQRGGVFADQKTFVDCVPRSPPAEIVDHYTRLSRSGAAFDLKSFVTDNFIAPETVHVAAPPRETLGDHLEHAWQLLRREADQVVAGSSLLALEHPYIIPGGRFREIYYWDTYFTILGLRAGGNHEDLILAMADNLAGLVLRHGLIPNGNRSYYLSRSHPPVFALIVELIAERHGRTAYDRYRPALEAELAYWNDAQADTHHRCRLPDGDELHRYYDREDRPRWEAFAIDELVAAEAGKPRNLFRDLRSAAESGWDFSSRWFVGGHTIAHTRTTEFAAVDLNCFLLQLERTLAKAWQVAGDSDRAAALHAAAARRSRAILRHCWSEAAGFFFDHHLPSGDCSPHRTLAGATPLFLGIATPDQAAAVADTLRADFLRAGGLVTTLVQSTEQWDLPNGWAPLQWIAIRGLANYGHHELAAEIAGRWIRLNTDVFTRTGRLLEKYNVVDLAGGGGGEYPIQNGFGWTNGVLLALLQTYSARKA